MLEAHTPFIPVVSLLLLGFLGVVGILGGLITYLRVGNEPHLNTLWILIWFAMGVPSTLGAFTIWYMMEAIRHGLY